MIKTTVLTDNVSETPGLSSEWGLSLFIEFNGKKILLDTGASPLFLENAKKLAKPIKDVDFAVLSHAHYDHSDGFEAFFTENPTAKTFISPNALENCYHVYRNTDMGADLSLPYDENGEYIKYDGIVHGLLDKFENRFVRAEIGVTEISKDVFLVPHTTTGLEAIGKAVGQYKKIGNAFFPDDYSHEQSLVIRDKQGITVYNSCSHGGVDNIIREAETAFPGEKVIAMIGGFHFFRYGEEKVREEARHMAETRIKHVVTGHCTGDAQYLWLKDELSKFGIKAEKMQCGLTFEIN